MNFMRILYRNPCAGVVQIFATCISKNSPKLTIFNNFIFQIGLARKCSANFGDFNFQKSSELRTSQFLIILISKSLSRASVMQILATSNSKIIRTSQFLTILTSKSLSRAGVVQILATSSVTNPPHPSVLRS